MKKLLWVFVLLFTLTACGSPMIVNGRKCPTYGLATKEQMCKNADHKLIIGNIIWAVIFSETLVVPVLIICTSLWEPVGPKEK